MTKSAPAITSSAPSLSLTEWADKSADETANTPHTATGAMTFTDADVNDVHTASFVPQGGNYLGTFSLGSVNDADGAIAWSFSVLERN